MLEAYLQLIYFHCDVVRRPLVCEEHVFKGHSALTVLHLPANLLELHQQPCFLLVIFSVGFNHFIMVEILAGSMSDFSGGDCKKMLGPQTSENS